MDQAATTNGREPSALRTPPSEGADETALIASLQDAPFCASYLRRSLEVVRDDVADVIDGLAGARRDIERRRLRRTLAEIDRDLMLIERAGAGAGT